LDIVVEDGETTLPIIIDILRDEGVSIKRISIVKPNLDDVFLKYVGTLHFKGSSSQKSN
jgi:ABC-2 type transport system ATP-binding protein